MYHWAMQFSRNDPSVTVAGGKTSFLRSLNGGITWTEHTSGLSGGAIQSIAPDWNNSSNIYTVSYDGIYKSTNTGTSWSTINNGLYLGQVLCLHYTDASPYSLYASLVNLGLWRSTNNGTSWTEVDVPLDCGDLCAVVTQSGNPNRILALEGTG